jgi:hypothetical protein
MICSPVVGAGVAVGIRVRVGDTGVTVGADIIVGIGVDEGRSTGVGVGKRVGIAVGTNVGETT